MVSEARANDVMVSAVVAAVPDPELPFLTIADLGILRSVTVEGRRVRVAITPTYSGCPALQAIADDIVAALPDHDVMVETVLTPAWTTDWITSEGREMLQRNGIAPPGTGTVTVSLVQCPQCGSRDCEELSRFSGTSCKALWRCRACREPFEQLKRH